MKLLLERDPSNSSCTPGALYKVGAEGKEFICYTLEDVVRETSAPVSEWKIKGETAIPRGTYQILITDSTRFKKPLPLLLDVPGFSGIRIHAGNRSVDSEGCVLLGKSRPENKLEVWQSRDAVREFMVLIQGPLDDAEEVWIEVV